MPYAATVVNIMIASPSDVIAERQVVRDLIDEWNTMHGERNGLVLMAIGWESHVSPELGDRPQGIINAQLLARADVLVALFQSRLGTETGEAESGTAEEIERHATAGKPTMLYFSEAPISRSTLSVEQYQRLGEFRKKMLSRGIVESFTSKLDFETRFRRQLNERVMANYSSLIRARELQPTSGHNVELSDVAATILLVAEDEGDIWSGSHSGGTFLQVGNKCTLNTIGNLRSTAKWRSGIDELESAGMLRQTSVSENGESWELTNEAFQAIDQLKDRGFTQLPLDPDP